MKTRRFGRTGWDVSEIGFGAWPIGQRANGSGSYGVVDPDEGRRVVERYVELGGTFIDTARAYGTSEEIIGSCSFMKDRRDSVFIATKTHSTSSEDQLSEIESDLHTSLRNLQTDYVDLYQIHSPPEDPELIKRLVDILQAYKEKGHIRAIGASVKGPDVTDATVDLACAYIDTGGIDALQIIYSMFRRAHDRTLERARERDVAIIARTVLENGFLSGKYEPGATFPDDHRRRWGSERLSHLLEAAVDLKEHAVRPPFESLAQVAIKFALMADGVSTVIPGAKRVSQVESNVAVSDLPDIDPDILERIRQGYPGIGERANTGD